MQKEMVDQDGRHLNKSQFYEKHLDDFEDSVYKKHHSNQIEIHNQKRSSSMLISDAFIESIDDYGYGQRREHT
jgi:hypothetical protein